LLLNSLDFGVERSGTAIHLWRVLVNTATIHAACLRVAEGEVSMDIEQLLYEAGRLHDADCLMNRIAQD